MYLYTLQGADNETLDGRVTITTETSFTASRGVMYAHDALSAYTDGGSWPFHQKVLLLESSCGGDFVAQF
ncbi:hypothetical protein [Verrucomicrobium spinosum]|uniref:hypothetical protein n=1 Tax=Verrucomicrobium spinosum TaxID=2736 RepID=UPI000946408B|nr:hypothetical protein [Verrucomicrobium spinosum]